MTIDIPRDRWGRPLIIPPGGGKPVPYARASGIGKVLEDDTNLTYWRARVVAIGLARRPDLQALVLGHQDHKDTELRNAVEEAFRAGGGEARRNQGTALHKLSELDDWAHLPDDLRADLDAFDAAMTTHGIEVLGAETFVVHDGWKIAGTMDRLVRVVDADGVGRRMVLDIKTGASVDYGGGSWAMQLRVYAEGLRYDPMTGARSPLHEDASGEYAIENTVGLIAHLPSGEGTCTIHEIDLSGAGEAIERALWVKDWRNRSRRLLTKLAPPAPTGTTATDTAGAGGVTDDQRAHLTRRYDQLLAQGVDRERLKAVWPEGVPGPKRSDAWRAVDYGPIAKALDRIEAAAATSFTDPPPAEPRRVPDPHRSTALRTPSIDEGEPVDEATIAATVAGIEALPKDQRDALHAIVATCGRDGHSLNLAGARERRYLIVGVLWSCGQNDWLDGGDEERLRALCAHVTGDDACLMPAVSLGEVVGSLTIEHARALLSWVDPSTRFTIDEAGAIRLETAA